MKGDQMGILAPHPTQRELPLSSWTWFSPMMRMLAPSERCSSKRELAGHTTPTDPRSRRIRASRKGRPCNELGLSAQRSSAACPHFRAPGAPRPGWAHHKAVLRGEQLDERGTAATMPDNGMVERFNGRIQREVLGITIASHGDLETLLRGFNQAYNARRQRVLKGRSPERVVRERLSAAPARANPSHDPPFDPCSLPKALQVITRAKDVSHPDR